MIVFGFDPGKGGACAAFEVIDAKPKPKMKAIDIIDMPLTPDREIDVIALRIWLLRHHASGVYLESAHPRPRDGKPQVFSSGQSFGLLKATIRLYGHEPVIVSPQTWKKRFGLISHKPDGETEKDAAKRARGMKTKSREMASRLMPDAAKWLTRGKDDGRGEALLIAMYGAEQVLDRNRVARMGDAA